MGNAYALPDTCVKLQQMLNDDSTNIDDIAQLVSYDPIISGLILKLANSALYNFPSQIDTVSKAIKVLGSDAVYNLVMACGTSGSLSNISTKAIDLDLFWQHSINTGLILKKLAHHYDKKQAEFLFLLGLMHNLGELVVANYTPELAKQCNQFDKKTQPFQVQQSVLSFSYTNLSAELLRHWNFPEKMIDALNNANTPIKAEPELLLYFASRLALTNTYPELYSVESIIPQAVLKHYGLSDKDIEELLEIVNLETFSVFSYINPGASAIY